MVLRRHGLLIIFIAIAVALVACKQEEAVTDQMYDHLEESVKLEDDYLNYQKEISELEVEEQEIYDQVRDLSMDQFDELQSLATKALEIVDKRSEKMELEKESIEESKEEFLKIDSLINEIEEDDVKQSAQEMYDQMNKRYDYYDELYESYSKSLELEQHLYEMVQEEETTNDDVTSHTDEINDSYDQVLSVNDEFNDATTKYNELKKEFYETADMDIQYDED